ncbi:MAG: ABC transporter ATP-binding protein [Clostridia bacterium]|jgi:NitT/TauT family transport system ATP-binding protein
MLSIKNLTKSYGDNEVLKDFSLGIEEHLITCILGKSGSGKTTLLNILSSLIDEYKGDVTDFRDKSFSYIFQESRLISWYDVYRNLEFVMHKKDDNAIMKCLKMVDMEAYTASYPSELSGGMAQRVSIARAFLEKSDILLMDEPFKGLDPTQKNDIVERFMQLWKEDKRTVVYVTHDIDEALYIGNDIVIIGEKPAKVIYNKKNVDMLNDDGVLKEKEKIWQILRSQM